MSRAAGKPRTLRLFIAAEAPESLRDACVSLQHAMREKIPGARWSRPEGIHLTLKFLGAAQEEQLAALSRAMASVAGLERPFQLVTGKAGLFGSLSHPRALWISLEGDVPAAGRLAAALDEATATLGFPKETRTFTAHLTLARFDQERGARLSEAVLALASQQVAGQAFPVRELTLFESHMMAGGSRYLVRTRAPLGGSGT